MRTLKLTAVVVLLIALLASTAPAQQPSDSTKPATEADRVIDRVIEREHALVQAMAKFHPMVETYYQTIRPDEQLGSVPVADRYFLGRLETGGPVQERFYLDVPPAMKKSMAVPDSAFYDMKILPVGFSSTIFVDRSGFDRAHYSFKFLRREFLGEVRCIVFDVTPLPKSGRGRFLGRIWVEDRDYNLVRFNGMFVDPPPSAYYFHMDSWRANLQPGLWLPSHVYSEETGMEVVKGRPLRFKAQTRLWAYDLKHAGRQQEFTDVLVDSPAPVKDESLAANDASPVNSARTWQNEAEENVVERLEAAGLLAARGDVDNVLNTVVNNLQVTNNLDISDVRCRVLLTTPLESLTIGRTIVISRGLLDVLPDEASLAMVLSHELAHIVLGHPLDTKYAFGDRMLFRDEHTYKVFGFQANDIKEKEADQRALELLQKSPYADKLQTAGLFLRALQANARALPHLLRAQLGNGLVAEEEVVRMPQLMASAPELQPTRTDQIAALPIGTRIRLNPWNDKVEMSKAKPVALVSAREKMALEVTPIIPHLARIAETEKMAAGGSGN